MSRRISSFVILAAMCVIQICGQGYMDTYNRPVLLAHRGSRYIAAENTPGAYEIAFGLGADVIELDVYLSSDGKLIVYHDPVVNRTTNGTGPIALKSFEEIRSLDAAYRFSTNRGESFPLRGRGIQIPAFEEVLQQFPQAHINIEIKPDDIAVADSLADDLRRFSTSEHPIEKRVIVGSRWCTVMKHFRSLMPTVSTSACEKEATAFVLLQLVGLQYLWKSIVAAPLPSVFQIPAFTAGIRLGTRSFVQAAHAAGLKVHFWVINEPDHMRALLETGCDGIVSDRVDLATKVFEEAGFKQRPISASDVQFYAPEYLTPDDEHTCVTMVCFVVQFVGERPWVLAIPLLMILYGIVLTIRTLYRCVVRPSRPRKAKSH
eukprot:TRINITY_DN11271_c0_g1_i1.p1 TRINITY_DN11271_c0_g1~~TRINITY_DN11271_c0_g1_i1.p1  ORF type:complete len:375 (-),score=62.84 TRINITY_DN11271_c0_g1_i1:65-1189(-)